MSEDTAATGIPSELPNISSLAKGFAVGALSKAVNGDAFKSISEAASRAMGNAGELSRHFSSIMDSSALTPAAGHSPG